MPLPQGHISTDALVFGLGHFRTAKSTLSFGGQGATMRITDRARAALDELIREGYAEPSDPTDQIPGREYFIGTIKEPSLGGLAANAGLNFFNMEVWTSFEKIENDPDMPSGSVSITFT